MRVRRSLCLALPPLLWACSSASRTPAARAPAASEAPERPELVFSHAGHAEQEIACATCHAGIARADRLGGRHAPAKAACAACHEVAKRDTCATCHRDLRRAGKVRRPPTPRLIFSHAKHLARRAECPSCHAGAAVATSVEGIERPRMKGDCFSCHVHLREYRQLRCKRCHESLAHYPLAAVSSFSHEGNFLREHGRWARASSDLCASCHGQSFCADCHSQRAALPPSLKLPERGDRAFIHRGDWIGRHSVESRGAPARCARCHGAKACERCHRARGVSALARDPAARTSPHPADWVSPGSPNSHGGEARRRITQCAACHDQGSLSNCVRCHRTAARGGLGLKPHPPGWQGGNRTRSTCLVCH